MDPDRRSKLAQRAPIAQARAVHAGSRKAQKPSRHVELIDRTAEPFGGCRA
jgi:hypothetical protein